MRDADDWHIQSHTSHLEAAEGGEERAADVADQHNDNDSAAKWKI